MMNVTDNIELCKIGMLDYFFKGQEYLNNCGINNEQIVDGQVLIFFTLMIICLMMSIIVPVLISICTEYFFSIKKFFKKMWKFIVMVNNLPNILFNSKICSCCNKRKIFTNKYRGRVYCNKCYREKFKFCSYCDKNITNSKIEVHNNENYCSKCYKYNILKCEKCDESFHKNNLKSFGRKKYCRSCFNSVYREFKSISFSYTKNKSNGFKINPHKRWCGVEIECLNKDRDSNCFIRSELSDLGFCQGTDGSVRGFGARGIEFRSLIFQGDRLLKTITNFCNQLDEKDYFINKSCGLHIHLAVDQDVEELKKMFIFYKKYENLIFRMLPKSRQNSDYCQKFSRHYEQSAEYILKNIKTLNDFKNIVYDGIFSDRYSHDHNKRYCWSNFHSIFYRGTLEIRAHSGTVNDEKINNWFLLHLYILDYLKGRTAQEIYDLKLGSKDFLDIFPVNLQVYIVQRWNKFKYSAEENN